jgi:membrane protein DedA with SNARE-associated domain
MCVDLVTRPRSGTGTKVVVLVIVLITVLVLCRAGYPLPDAITMALGGGLAGSAVARSLTQGVGTRAVSP